MGRRTNKEIREAIAMGGEDSDALNVVGTEAEDRQTRQEVMALWDRTFVCYAPDICVKLPYHYQAAHSTSASTTAGAHQFKINSIYDIDLTSTGHQPLGRDTWAGIYEYYKVLETRIHVKVFSLQYRTQQEQVAVGTTFDVIDVNDAYPLDVGGLLDITATPPANRLRWREASKVTANEQEHFSEIQELFNLGSRGNTEITYDMRWTPGDFDSTILNQSVNDAWTPVGSDPDNGALNYFTHLVSNRNSTTSANYSLEIDFMQLVAFKQLKRSLLHTTN